MAFSGDYAEATITNPASALTDFTVLVDLSTMPADWWTAVDTSDGTKGRAVLDSGPTEVASDWIDFDNVAETGWVRAKWAGTLSNTGTQILRIYPPKAANASYAAGATFGQHNAYDANWLGYWPDGGGPDRTSNGTDATVSGTTQGGIAGQVGGATRYDDPSISTKDVHAAFSTTGATFGGTSPITAMAWAAPVDSNANFHSVFAPQDDSFEIILRYTAPSGLYSFVLNSFSSNDRAEGGTAPAIGTFSHIAGTFDGTDIRVYGAGSQAGVATPTGTYNDQTSWWIGQASAPTTTIDYGEIDVDDAQLHTTARSADWISHEYDQSNDQATFWGTWTWSGAGGATPTAADNRSYPRGVGRGITRGVA